MTGPKIVRVTAADIETGEDGTVELAAGEYVCIPVEPLYLASTQRHANGTVVLTLKRATETAPEEPT